MKSFQLYNYLSLKQKDESEYNSRILEDLTYREAKLMLKKTQH